MEIKTPAVLFLSLLPLLIAPANALKVERLAVTGQAAVSAAGRTVRADREVASGRAFVKFETGTSSNAAAAALSAAGFGFVWPDYPGGWALAGLPEGMSVAAGLAVLKSLPAVSDAEPSSVYRAKLKSSDPALVLQYGLRKADAFRAWDYETGFSSRAMVAVMDTGIDGSHPDLASKLAGTSQFCSPGANKNIGGDDLACAPNDPPTPACNHGTRVAGIAAAATDNFAGVAGVSWGAGLLSLKVFRDEDCTSDCGDAGVAGSCATDDWAVVNAIQYARTIHNSTTTGRIVLNMSFGEAAGCSAVLQNKIDEAVADGLVLVAAAGNSGTDGVDSPANCLGVIPVGATDINDNIAQFSAIGSEMSNRGVSAPGVGIYTTDLRSGYAYGDGTSFASPFVAGLAALVLSANPALSSSQAGDVIRNSADNRGTPTAYGFGRVNAYKAVLWALGKQSLYSTPPGLEKAFAYPNPYKPSSGRPLSFSMPDSVFGSGLEVSVFTSEGEKVKEISEPVWDGKNEAGHDVASGVYLFIMKTDRGSAIGKFAVLR